MSSDVGTSRVTRRDLAPLVLVVLVLIAALLGPSRASGDWLVTTQGERVETHGPWRIEGDSVLFTRTDGNLASLALREVDLGQSRLLSREANRPNGSPSESAISGGSLESRGDSELTTGGVLDAREEWAESRRSRDRVEARVQVGSLRYDNYFQAPEDEAQEEIQATSADLRLMWRLGETSLYKGYVQLNRVEYETLPATSAYGLGFRLDGRRHYLDLFSRVETNRGALDIGDEFEEAEILRHHVGYSLRFARAWEWSLETDFRDQDFEVSTTRDTELFEAESALRYRGFGRSFSPEFGVRWGARDALNDDYDYTENDLYLKLRFSPARFLAFSVRLRERTRDYDVRHPSARTFGREDSRRQWTASADFLVRPNLAFNLYYDYVDGDSSDPGRIFTTQLLAGYLTFKAGTTAGLRGPGTKEPPRLSPSQRERPEGAGPPVVAEGIDESEDPGEIEGAAENLVAGRSDEASESVRDVAPAPTEWAEIPTGREEATLVEGSEEAPVAADLAHDLLARRSDDAGAAVHAVERAAAEEV